jgi:serine/threonine-protein kinase
MGQHPARFGKYPVLRILGHGTTGTVYEVRDTLAGRRLAVKALLPELAQEPEVRERFWREAQAAGTLRHPNIASVYELGEEAGQPWLAMELVAGSDLQAFLHRGPPPVEWTIDLLRQLCEGLSYAHAHGIVHRDLKPSNVRITPAGEVKILDFGLARVPGSSLTKRGVTLGSVLYLAPEQIEGDAVDGRADVFAVGGLGFEMLAGRRPFEAESLPALLARIAEARVDARLLPKTPYSPELEEVVLKALRRAPEDRHSSLDQLRSGLLAAVRAAAARA